MCELIPPDRDIADRRGDIVDDDARPAGVEEGAILVDEVDRDRPVGRAVGVGMGLGADVGGVRVGAAIAPSGRR
jgi:hypothetical protein